MIYPTLNTTKVNILVEKRTYRPAGWKKLREFIVPCRLTEKRIHVKHLGIELVFDRATGQEVTTQEDRINQSYRYTVTSTAEFG